MNLNLGDTQLILRTCRKHNLTHQQTAYVLATAFHETAHTMKPVREAFWLSEVWRRDNLRYYPWYGRGYVQLTWKRNYVFASYRLKKNLTRDPDVVMSPKISVEILVLGMKEGWFTGKRLPEYINEERKDYYSARRVVNALDKASLIASYAEKYEKAIPRRKTFSWRDLFDMIWNRFFK